MATKDNMSWIHESIWYCISILLLNQLSWSLTSESICFLWLPLLSVDMGFELIVVYVQWPLVHRLVPLVHEVLRDRRPVQAVQHN